MMNVVGPVEDDAVRAEIEAHVLGLLDRKTPPQLGDCARRIVLRKDADAAARKLVAAVRERGSAAARPPRRHRHGVLDLPLPAAAAIYRALEGYAKAARVDGDERTKQQRMADCVQALILRPGENGMPPVTIALTLVATLETMLGGAEPGQVEGMLVPAEMVRELGYAFGLMPRPAPDVADLPDDDPERPAEADGDARQSGDTVSTEPERRAAQRRAAARARSPTAASPRRARREAAHGLAPTP